MDSYQTFRCNLVHDSGPDIGVTAESTLQVASLCADVLVSFVHVISAKLAAGLVHLEFILIKRLVSCIGRIFLNLKVRCKKIMVKMSLNKERSFEVPIIPNLYTRIRHFSWPGIWTRPMSPPSP